MNHPTLSIIIPVYNSGKSISRVITSITSQSFRDFELLLIDDGSTDDTLSELKKLEKKDNRISVLTKKNGGPSSARNLGIERSRGSFIQFFDADDIVAPNALSVIAEAMKQHNPDMLVSGWQIDLQTKNRLIKNYKQISPKKMAIAKDIKTHVLRSIGIDGTLYNLWNKLFKADIIRKNGLRFREDLKFGEDLVFAFNYLNHVKSIKIIPDVTYHYQANSKTSIVSKSALVTKYRNANYQELENFAGEKRTSEAEDLYNWIRWRWLLSYWLRISDASIPYNKKIELMKQPLHGTFIVAKNARFIGRKKLFQERVAQLLIRLPRTRLLCFWIVGKMKLCLVRIKMFVNRFVR